VDGIVTEENCFFSVYIVKAAFIFLKVPFVFINRQTYGSTSMQIEAYRVDDTVKARQIVGIYLSGSHYSYITHPHINDASVLDVPVRIRHVTIINRQEAIDNVMTEIQQA
jgi:hypothetical protein